MAPFTPQDFVAKWRHVTVKERSGYQEHFRNWLNPPGADQAELKKRTLTNLYNARPTWLSNAHRALDEAVLAAYGWPADLGDEAILERLLTLNLARAAGQGAG